MTFSRLLLGNSNQGCFVANMIPIETMVSQWREQFIQEIVARVNPEAKAKLDPECKMFWRSYELYCMKAADGTPVGVQFMLRGELRSMFLQMRLTLGKNKFQQAIDFRHPKERNPTWSYLSCGTDDSNRPIDPMPVIEKAADALNYVLGYPSNVIAGDVALSGNIDE